MTKQTVLDRLLFWEVGAWVYGEGARPAPAYLLEDEEATILETISQLYDDSSHARAWLEDLAGQGSIRIAGATNSGTYYQSIAYTHNGSTVITDPYLTLDPEIHLHVFNSFGTMFEMPFELILAHEVSHWANGSLDPLPYTNAAMNGQSYDFVGDNVHHEWDVATDMGMTDFRVSYNGSLTDNDPRFSLLDPTRDYADGYVQIVRFGDFEKNSSGALLPNDHIDFSARTDGKNTLSFGFTGNDTMVGGSGKDWLYGGGDSDIIHGGLDRDWLDGEDGNDFLEDSSAQLDKNVIIGGDGDDIIVTNNAIVTLGAGADQLWLPVNAAIVVTDADASDSLYWNGYHVTGGSATMVDLEIDQSSGDIIYYNHCVMDANGIEYDSGNGMLFINLPGNSGGITVENWSQGDLGITLDLSDQYVGVSFDENGNYAGYYASLPDAPGVNDGIFEQYTDLPQYANVVDPGSFAFPTTFI